MHTNRNQIFYQEYLGYPTQETEGEKKLRELAEDYVRRCEAFDRTVCTGPIKNGAIIPANMRESAIISRHALEMREQFLAEIQHQGFTRRDFIFAARKADRTVNR